MNTTPFHIFWDEHYPESVPLGHLLRQDYPGRWFRIHSLPNSKRYADNKKEWKTLLKRQNTLITDLLGTDAEFYLVTGRYYYVDMEIANLETEYHKFECFRKMDLRESEAINLFERYPKEYGEEDGVHYIPVATVTTWKPGTFDDLLEKIADDETRAIFVGIQRPVIVAPYDGGVDCIVEDAVHVKYCKNAYKNWLSQHELGL